MKQQQDIYIYLFRACAMCVCVCVCVGLGYDVTQCWLQGRMNDTTRLSCLWVFFAPLRICGAKAMLREPIINLNKLETVNKVCH